MKNTFVELFVADNDYRLLKMIKEYALENQVEPISISSGQNDAGTMFVIFQPKGGKE